MNKSRTRHGNVRLTAFVYETCLVFGDQKREVIQFMHKTASKSLVGLLFSALLCTVSVRETPDPDVPACHAPPHAVEELRKLPVFFFLGALHRGQLDTTPSLACKFKNCAISESFVA